VLVRRRTLAFARARLTNIVLDWIPEKSWLIEKTDPMRDWSAFDVVVGAEATDTRRAAVRDPIKTDLATVCILQVTIERNRVLEISWFNALTVGGSF
jgi:hypothetical protein